MSRWLTLNGAMPQGSWLGPLSFLIMTDDLDPGCVTHKYVDDTILTEVLSQSDCSCVQNYIQNVIDWVFKNDMLLNGNKTKEMILGPCSKLNRPNLLLTSSGCIERVTQFKLLGVFIDSTLSWNAHIDYIVKKAAKRLYFLSFKTFWFNVFLCCCCSPILEYCLPVWNHNLVQYLSDKIESIQKRAIRIIFSVT